MDFNQVFAMTTLHKANKLSMKTRNKDFTSVPIHKFLNSPDFNPLPLLSLALKPIQNSYTIQHSKHCDLLHNMMIFIPLLGINYWQNSKVEIPIRNNTSYFNCNMRPKVCSDSHPQILRQHLRCSLLTTGMYHVMSSRV
jgi:hypothetical protein